MFKLLINVSSQLINLYNKMYLGFSSDYFVVEQKILILSLSEIWIKEHHVALNHVYDLL